MASDPDRAAGAAGRGVGRGAVAVAAELRAALFFSLGVEPPDPRRLSELARGMAFLPAIGLLSGLALGLAARAATAAVPGVVVAPAIVALLLLLQRGEPALAVFRAAAAVVGGGMRRDGAAGRGRGEAAPPLGAQGLASLALAVLLAAKALALAALAGPALGLALALAVMLGRWAIVVQAYGSIAAPGDGFAATLVRDMKFRELAVASVSAMALTLVLSAAVGLVLLLVAAASAVALRILVHRLRGGVTRTSLLVGGEVAEGATLIVCAVLARLLAGT